MITIYSEPRTGEELGSQLKHFLSKVEIGGKLNAKAIICPHAGYSYSGPVAAYSYSCVSLDPAM